MSITLHKNLPMPSRVTGRTAKYPFTTLTEVGDSFVEDDIVDSKKAAARLTAAVGSFRRTAGKDAPKFSVRVFQIEGKDAVGVWRV